MKEISPLSLRSIHRRALLQSAGVSMSLPFLESFAPRVRGADATLPRRMVLICGCLGLHGPDFFPKQTGFNYELSPYLKELADFRRDFTVFSGLSHPEVGGGHNSEASFLTAAMHANSPSFRNSISLDQYAAERIGSETRYPFLALATDRSSLSWTRNGVQIPADKDPGQVFRRLFVTGTPDEVRKQSRLLQEGYSVLDSVRTETASLQRKVSVADRERLDQYFTAVRAVEGRLKNAEAWEQRPKPRVDVESLGQLPAPADIVGRVRLMYDLIHLAIQSDSTRLITLTVDQASGVPPIQGVSEGYHPLSHHGMDPSKIAQLRLIELEELRALSKLLSAFQSSVEVNGTLLDNTMVMYGSNLGNASSHDTHNLPILLAGGGFQHGQHLSFGSEQNKPLSNLYVSMLQRLGMETERFGTSTGTVAGLEVS